MDPFTIAFGVAGLATSIFGSMKSSGDASKIAATSRNIAGLEQQQNDVRQQAMEVSGRRQSLETIRQTQKAMAMGLNAGVNQNAQFGSGVQGGQAETSNEGLFNLQGINQNLMAGRQMFGLSNQISGQRMQMATLQGNMATDQGMSALGNDIGKAAPMLGNLTSQAFGGMGGLGSIGSSIFGAVNRGGMLFQG